jgi:hypothetical protein
MGRTYRKEYRESRRFDKSCRCHGGCPYCEENRLHNYRKRRKEADEEIREETGMDTREQTDYNLDIELPPN